MPVDSNGNVTRPPSPIPVSGQNADAPQVNVPVNDIYAILNLVPFLDGRKPFRGPIPMNGYQVKGAANATDPQDCVTLSQVQAMIASIVSIPTGAIMFMAGASVPTGWLVMNGQAVSRSTYAGLYAFAASSGNMAASEGVKTHGQFGPGDGSTTFTLPNLYADNGYFIRPVSSGRGIGTVQADENRNHSHTGSTGWAGAHGHIYTRPLSATIFLGQNAGSAYISAEAANTDTAPNHSHSFTTDASGGTEARPRNIAYPVLIKT